MKNSLADILQLEAGDIILTAYAEPASGPGWANKPLIVIIQTAGGTIRQSCLQPMEQPRDVRSLYDISAAVQREMMGILRAAEVNR